MKNLLHLEFRKLSRQKSFYICTGIMLLLLFLLLRLVSFPVEDIMFSGLYDIGVEILLSTIGLASFDTFFCIFVTLLVCADHTQKTIRNILARGYTRGQVFFSKLIVSLAATTIMYVLAMATGFFSVIRQLGIASVDLGKLLALLGAQYVMAMTYTAFYYAIAAALCKTGASIVLGLFLPGIVDSVLSLIDVDLCDYWITTFFTHLSSITTDWTMIVQCVVLSLIYIAVFLGIGFFAHQKKELS